MITKVSYKPYNSSVSNGQNQSQNVNFGTLDLKALHAGRNLAYDLLNLANVGTPHLKVNCIKELIRHLEQQAGETMTVQELVAAAKQSGLLPIT